MYDSVGAEMKSGFDCATSEAFVMFLKITMITVQVNGDEMAWMCENTCGTEHNVGTAHSFETFAWEDNGDLLIKAYCPTAESVGKDADPYGHLLDNQCQCSPDQSAWR